MSLLKTFLASTAAFHIAAVLFGAPFVEYATVYSVNIFVLIYYCRNFVSTLSWAVLMSILTILVPKLLCASDCQAILRFL